MNKKLRKELKKMVKDNLLKNAHEVEAQKQIKCIVEGCKGKATITNLCQSHHDEILKKLSS